MILRGIKNIRANIGTHLHNFVRRLSKIYFIYFLIANSSLTKSFIEQTVNGDNDNSHTRDTVAEIVS